MTALQARVMDAIKVAIGDDVIYNPLFGRKGEIIIDGRIMLADVADAVIRAVFHGSLFAEIDGMIVICNPEFPPHYWRDGTMTEIQINERPPERPGA